MGLFTRSVNITALMGKTTTRDVGYHGNCMIGIDRPRSLFSYYDVWMKLKTDSPPLKIMGFSSASTF